MFWKKKKVAESRSELPPGQGPIPEILRWGIDHPGIANNLPKISKEQYTLIIDGEVNRPLVLSWNDFLALPQSQVVSDFHCVEGWSVLKQRWEGVLFRIIQKQAKPNNAKFAWFECADGYTTSLPLNELQGDDVILAYKLNGEELSQSLGGPMRLVVPQKYAYKSPMWLIRITFSNLDKLGYWEKGYYSNTADIWRNDRYRTDV